MIRHFMHEIAEEVARIIIRAIERHALPVVELAFNGITLSFHGGFTMQFPDTQGPITATIANFVDAKGNATTDSDVPVWSSSDASIATVVADPTTPNTATVTPTGALGQAQISAVYGDPAAGGFSVLGSIEVVPGHAVSGSMTLS